MKTEPVVITRIAEFVLVAVLLAAAKWALGRPLEWLEVMGIAALVLGPGTLLARAKVVPLGDAPP